MSNYILRPAGAGAHEIVVYVPGVGGRTSFVAGWQHPERPVAAAIWTTPGRSASITERGRELASALAEQTSGDVLLVGHSLGALIAFEAAVRSPGRIKALLLLAQYPPHAMRRYSPDDLQELPVLASLEAAIPSELTQVPGFLDVMRELWRNDYLAAAEYQPSACAEVPIVAIGATDDRVSRDLAVQAEWHRYGSHVQTTLVPGEHNFVEQLTGDELRRLINEFVRT